MKYIKLFENSIEEISSSEYSKLYVFSLRSKIKFDKKEDIKFIELSSTCSYEPFRDSYVKLQFNKKIGYLEIIKLPDDYYLVYNSDSKKCYKIDQLQSLIKFINNQNKTL